MIALLENTTVSQWRFIELPFFWRIERILHKIESIYPFLSIRFNKFLITPLQKSSTFTAQNNQKLFKKANFDYSKHKRVKIYHIFFNLDFSSRKIHDIYQHGQTTKIPKCIQNIKVQTISNTYKFVCNDGNFIGI